MFIALPYIRLFSPVSKKNPIPCIFNNPHPTVGAQDRNFVD